MAKESKSTGVPKMVASKSSSNLAKKRFVDELKRDGYQDEEIQMSYEELV